MAAMVRLLPLNLSWFIGRKVPTGDTQMKATLDEMASSLGLYVKRWQRWAVAGLHGVRIEGLSSNPGFTFTDSDQAHR
jgi:hypothetical protein